MGVSGPDGFSVRVLRRSRELGGGGALTFPAIALFIALGGCGPETALGPGPVESTWPEWASVANAGFTASGLEAATEYTRSLETTGLMVVVAGRVLLRYGDTRELSYVASVRKSILSMLYGPHVDAGTIDLDATLEELGIDDEGGLLPIEKSARLRDLLSARSGVYHAASNGGDDSEAAPPRGSKEPGTYFLYNNWDFNAAGGIFEQETGEDIYAALESRLARPLQMEDFHRDLQRKSGDLDTSRFPAYHIWLSTRDMARIGELMLRGGRWGGTQVIPESWVRASTRAITPVEEMNPESRRTGTVGFGMMWWVWDGPAAAGAFEGAYTAAGAYGQFITVLPALDMVVAHKTAVGDGRGFGRRTLFAEYRGLLERLAAAAGP